MAARLPGRRPHCEVVRVVTAFRRVMSKVGHHRAPASARAHTGFANSRGSRRPPSLCGATTSIHSACTRVHLPAMHRLSFRALGLHTWVVRQKRQVAPARHPSCVAQTWLARRVTSNSFDTAMMSQHVGVFIARVNPDPPFLASAYVAPSTRVRRRCPEMAPFVSPCCERHAARTRAKSEAPPHRGCCQRHRGALRETLHAG